MAEQRVQVVLVEADHLETELMSWSGASRAWERCISYWGKKGRSWEHQFVEEVVGECSYLSIDYEEWDGGLPGRSGLICSVETSDPAAARRELRRELATNIWAWRSELRLTGNLAAQVPSATSLSAKAELYSVRGTPVAVELVRGWGGYGGYRVTSYDVPGGRPFPRDEVTRNGTAISRLNFDALMTASTGGQRTKSDR